MHKVSKTTVAAIFSALLITLTVLNPQSVFAASPPASVNAAIGSPANGIAHHLTINWSSVTSATAYVLEYSTDNITWNPLYTGAALTYDHNASTTGNMPFYYRVSSIVGTQSTPQNCTQFPIYTACDNPALPQLSAATSNSISVQLIAETPTPNPAYTTYSITCSTTGQFVQANGTLGATEVFQTRATWATLALTGLTASTNYCFYAKAKNNDGDTRLGTVGSGITTVQTFDASNTLNISQNGSTSAYWTPPSPTSGNPLTWKSTGGCSGGTGAGNVGFSGSFTNFFGSFLRTPIVNCTGNTSVVLSFDLSNSYIASHIVTSPSSSDAMRFYIYNNGGAGYITVPTTVKIGGVDHSSVDGNGTWLKFDAARSCVHVDVTFDLSSQSSVSSLLFYLEADNPYNDGNTFSVNIDNVNVNQGAPVACLSTTACTAASISANPNNGSICANDNTSLSITATGSVATYQWQYSTDGGSTWNNLGNTGVYTGANAAQLNITGATNGLNGYQYRAQITGACSGTSTSTAATLTVNSPPATPGTITGLDTLCVASNTSYSVASVTGATSYTWTLPNNLTGTSTSNSISITAISSNTNSISVTANNSCGASIAQTKVVAAAPLPTVNYDYTGGLLCTDVSPFALTGATPTGGFYSGTGVTGGVFDPSTGAGSYVITYYYTSSLGCPNNDTSLIEVSICTDLSELKTNNANIYPNPFSTEFTVSITAQKGNIATLYDATGKKINSYEIPASGILNIHTTSLASGIYLLNILSAEGNNLITKRVIKVD